MISLSPARRHIGWALCIAALAPSLASIAPSAAGAAPLAAAKPTLQPRVVNGLKMDRRWTGWYLLFTPYDGKRESQCGATLISSRWALTAAHCVSDGRWHALAGKGKSYVQVNPAHYTAGPFVDVQKIKVHPNWQRRGHRDGEADLALLKLAKTIKAPKLPINVNPRLPNSGARAWVMGFGRTTKGTHSRFLMGGSVTDFAGTTQGKCGRYRDFIVRDEICAGTPGGGLDTCTNDSGGPLVSKIAGKNALVGVVFDGNGCGLAGYPGLYTRVSKYAKWISKNAAGVRSIS